MNFRKYLKESPDESNPEVLFEAFTTKILVDIASGKIDCKKLAIKHLESKFLDSKGNQLKR